MTTLRALFITLALAGLAAVAQDPPQRPIAAPAEAPAQPPPPGYVITPSGEIIFPAAPPPAGDTSTLSRAGPNVSEGPVVGSGPEVSTGPVAGVSP